MSRRDVPCLVFGFISFFSAKIYNEMNFIQEGQGSKKGNLGKIFI